MKTNYEKINEISATLPRFCDSFLYNGNSENSSTTTLNYALDIRYFFDFAINYLPYFSEKKIEDITIDDLKNITSGDINLYLSVMKERFQLSDKTRARRKSSISNLFKYLTDTEKLLEHNPVPGASSVKIHEKDYVIYLKREEQKQLLNCISYGTGLTKKQLAYHEKEKKRDLAIIFLFLDTGMRISEIRSINIKDIDFDEYCAYVVRKGGKTQKIFFSDESAEYLRDYLQERMNTAGYVGDDPLFISGKGNRIAVRTIQAMLEKYVNASLPGAENISPHKLRSSFAMEFYKQSRDILLLQKRMGHKTLAATNIYAKASEEEMIAESRNWRNE